MYSSINNRSRMNSKWIYALFFPSKQSQLLLGLVSVLILSLIICCWIPQTWISKVLFFFLVAGSDSIYRCTYRRRLFNIQEITRWQTQREDVNSQTHTPNAIHSTWEQKLFSAFSELCDGFVHFKHLMIRLQETELRSTVSNGSLYV